jgi:hypothetical protein
MTVSTPKTNVLIPPKPITVLEHGEQCRYCGRLAFIADEDGPVHRCCEMWAVELAAHRPCPSCAAGSAGNRKFQEQQDRRKQWR